MNILFILLIGIWFLRFFAEMGLDVPHRLSHLLYSPLQYHGEKLTKNDVYRILFFALIIRFLVYVAGVFACMALSDSWSQTTTFSWNDFFNMWNRSDASHYLDLAEKGYAGCSEITEWSGQEEHLFLVFFPLYPWLIRIIHFFVNSYPIAAFTVSIASFCIGCVFFYGVLKEEYGSSIAEKSLYLLLLYPFSFFFGGIMTESLFFCLISAGFFYIHRHKWLASGLIGLLASLCRVQGMILLGVGMVEFFIYYQPIRMIREKNFYLFLKHFFSEAVFLFLAPIGTIIYLLINYVVSGNALQFTIYQKNHWYHTTTWFTNCVLEITRYASTRSNSENVLLWYPDLILFLIAAILFIYALRTQPLKYSAYLLVYTLINYSVTFLLSGGRYMLNALPIFFFTAAWTDKHKLTYKIICFALAFLYGIYFTAFFTKNTIF